MNAILARRRARSRNARSITDEADIPAPPIGHNLPPEPIECEQAEAFEGLYTVAPVKCYYGGRGAAKSWAIARWLIGVARSETTRIGCFREFQSSIKDSVHRLLTDQIYLLGVQNDFYITKDSILCLLTGTEFIFKGLRKSIGEIKSTEGIKYTWVEEAQACSDESWQILLPTVSRVPGAQLIISFNPDAETDPTYKRFVKEAAPDYIVRKVNYYDNPWFSEEMDKLRLRDLEYDSENYDWIWEGNPRKISDAIIFRNRVVFDTFEPKEGTRFYYGLDFGFANDPNAFVECYIEDEELFINDERWGFQTEIDDLPKLLAGKEGLQNDAERKAWTHDDELKWPGIPRCKGWPIKADNARPETISYLCRQGLNVIAAEKWKGSVEDGIAHLKGFKKIHIHATRCPNVAREARLYSFKIDKQTGDVLPEIVDKWNHGWDAIRYALDGFIQRRGNLGVWAKLAKD